MVKLAVAAMLLLSPLAFAESSSQASANGTVVNQNSQVNQSGGSDLSRSTFGRDYVSCESGAWGVSLVSNKNNSDYMDNDNIAVMFTISGPTNFNGTISRCEDQQKAVINLTRKDAALVDLRIEIEAIRNEAEMVRNDMLKLKDCYDLHKRGLEVSVDRYSWIGECYDMTYHNPEAFSYR